MALNPTQQERLIIRGTLLVVFIAHIQAAGNYLSADDWVFMTSRTAGEALSFFYRSVIPAEWEAFWLRPLPMMSYWLDSLVWNQHAWWPHFVNVVLHVFNTWLVWLCVRHFTGGVREGKASLASLTAAWCAALFYGLHPLTVGAVTWVAGRFDVMSVSFGLAGLYLWTGRGGGRNVSRITLIASLLLLCAVLSKEQGIVFPAACGAVTLIQLFFGGKKHRGRLGAFLVLTAFIGAYVLYRMVLFGGVGGYMQARYGLNPALPVYYGIAVLFPFGNVYEGWSIDPFFVLAAAGIAALSILSWIDRPSETTRHTATISREHVGIALTLMAFGFATTSPHAGMALEWIMGHAESRFAVPGITGTALSLGIGIAAAARTPSLRRAVLVVAMLWAGASAWRTTVQIQAWHDAGETAESIIEQTLEQAPDPPPGSTLLYLDVPRNNEQYAYIFGIGLEEALELNYPGNPDLSVTINPTRRQLGTADPRRDRVFQYHEGTGNLERLHAVRPEQ